MINSMIGLIVTLDTICDESRDTWRVLTIFPIPRHNFASSVSMAYRRITHTQPDARETRSEDVFMSVVCADGTNLWLTIKLTNDANKNKYK